LQVGDHGRCALDSLLSQILQPLPARVGVDARGDRSEDGKDQQRSAFAEAWLAPRPVYQPDEQEGGGGRQGGAGRADSGHLELLGARGAVGREVGERCRPEAVLAAEKLRGDNQVAEVLQEPLVVRPSDA
jgi:hypothetical protein